MCGQLLAQELFMILSVCKNFASTNFAEAGKKSSLALKIARQLQRSNDRSSRVRANAERRWQYATMHRIGAAQLASSARRRIAIGAPPRCELMRCRPRRVAVIILHRRGAIRAALRRADGARSCRVAAAAALVSRGLTRRRTANTTHCAAIIYEAARRAEPGHVPKRLRDATRRAMSLGQSRLSCAASLRCQCEKRPLDRSARARFLSLLSCCCRQRHTRRTLLQTAKKTAMTQPSNSVGDRCRAPLVDRIWRKRRTRILFRKLFSPPRKICAKILRRTRSGVSPQVCRRPRRDAAFASRWSTIRQKRRSKMAVEEVFGDVRGNCIADSWGEVSVGIIRGPGQMTPSAPYQPEAQARAAE